MRAFAHGGKTPRLGRDVFVADDATLIGDVTLGDFASVWFGSVLRGDVQRIRIGARSNIQDLSVIHVSSAGHPTLVGDGVTVGHRVVLHACTIGDLCLIGIGAVVMDRAEIGGETLIGAGALVPPGMKIPSGVLALGAPAKVVRPLDEAEKKGLRDSADSYVRLAASYRGQLG